MPSDRSIIERQIESVELRPFTLDGFHRRRERKLRNRRIATAVVAVAVAAGGIGGMAWAFLSGPEPRPADQPSSRFVGTWSSREIDFPGIPQTMTIRTADDGALDITLHDDSSVACSTRQTRTSFVPTPSTMTGTGRLEGATTLVVPSPVVTCDDGRQPIVTGFPEEMGGASYTLVLDLATDRLFDDLGVVWYRGESGGTTGADSVSQQAVGPGPRSFLNGEITLILDHPWGDHIESYLDPRIFWLINGREPDYEAGMEVLANPTAKSSCGDASGVPASAEELVEAIRSNPDLETTAPVPALVGGVEAVRLDVAPARGAQTCPFGDPPNVPVVSVPGREAAWGSMNPGDRGRLYVLNLPRGSARALAILITAPEADFEQTVRDAAPVLDSFKFHTR